MLFDREVPNLVLLVGLHRLCNACGIRYARRLKKDAKAAAQASTTPKPCDDAGKRSTVYSLLN